MTLYDTIHLLAFNRPDYAVSVFSALAEQLEHSPSQPAVHIWIDGFAGSRDEEQGLSDHREQILELAAAKLPNATLHRQSTNIGIARIYHLAEQLTLRHSQTPYALFFEDDYVPGPHYFEAMNLLMGWGLDKPDVAIVTAHGIISEYFLNSLPDLPRVLPLQPLPVHSLWAFAIKLSHLRERSPFLKGYLQTMKRTRYRCRDTEKIGRYLTSHGLSFIHGTSQDYIKHAALLLHHKLAVSIPMRLGFYIGIKGEHSDYGVYEELGYARLHEENYDSSLFQQALGRPFDSNLLIFHKRLELLSMRILNEKNNAISRLLTAQEHLSRSQQELEDLKEQLLNPQHQLGKLEKQVSHSKQELEDVKRQLSSSQQELGDVKKHLSAAEWELEHAQEQLNAVLGSRSYLLTKPLRQAADWVKSICRQ